MPRIPYVNFDDLPEAKKAQMQGQKEHWDRQINVIKMMANSPVTFDAFARMGANLLLESDLDPVYREYAILRTAIVNTSRYEWAQHVPIAMDAGISPEKIAAMTGWKASGLFDDKETAVLTFIDEVLAHSRVSDDTFKAAEAFLSSQNLMELLLSIGYWNMVALVLNSMEVELEDNYLEKHGGILPNPEPEWE